MMGVLFILLLYFMNLLLGNNNKNMKLKKISLQILLLIMLMKIIMMVKMSKLFYWVMIYNYMGMDYLSWWLIMMTLWIFFLVLMYFNKSVNIKLMSYILLMIIILYLVFIYMNMFMFYLMFEISLIPILLMILGWGSMEDRISASFYMLMYTLFSSMPLLIFIFYMFNMNYTLMYFCLEKMTVINHPSLILYLMSFLGFFVKMPMYLFHLWLPKAHVEAPVYGSMILAAILLKLGSYGLYRFLIILDKLSMMYNYIFISVSLVGMLIMSMVCLMQIDMKIIVAYSSVVHMGLLMGGALTLSELGMQGSLLLMVAHGLCSSGMFCMVNMFYDRTQSRNLLINKGLLMIMPLLIMGWFLLCSSNLAAPPSLNLMGEILLISSMLSWNYLIMLLLMMVSFFSAVYSIYLFSIISHGKLNYNLMLFNSGLLMEYYLIFLHWIPLNFLILKLLT